MRYVINKSYPRQLYAFAALGAVLVGVVAFVPACNPDDWRWGVADVVMFSASAAFLTWYARRLSRMSFEVTEESLLERHGEDVVRTVTFSAVDALVDRHRQRVIEVQPNQGKCIHIPYQLAGIEGLVDLLVSKVNKPIRKA